MARGGTDDDSVAFSDTLSATHGGWTLIESGWEPDRAVAVGSNFMVGNGYLGYRATSSEQTAQDFVALVVTDTYDCADGRWRELTTAPNPLFVQVASGATVLRSPDAAAQRWELDLRDGGVIHRATHRVGDATLDIVTERFASADELHVLGQRVTVTTDTRVGLEVAAGIDSRVWNLNGVHLPDIEQSMADGEVLVAHGVTGESAVAVAVAAAVDGLDATPTTDDLTLMRRARVEVAPDRPLVVTTRAAVVTSSDVADPVDRAVSIVASADHDAARRASARNWAAFWDRNDVTVHGSVIDDAALRFSGYHNRICTPAHTDHLPVGARGLSCQAYQGAAFWDQEIYNLPAFLFTEPDIARSLLVYRHRTLDGARRKARRLGYQGAYYAWVSGETGDELCPDVFFTDVLTGREIRNHFNVWQMHVAPDIVTSIERYVSVTGDTGFLVDHGAEIAFEVARFLRSFVRYDDVHETYHCIRLLGPDEWHENVDDNAFTNHQAHAALSFAITTHEQMCSAHREALARLTDRLQLSEHEVERWRHVRDHLLLPAPDPVSLLVEQFDGFFDLEDIAPDDLRERLLDPSEYWGWPNGIAVRTQVSKQADVAMLTWLHAGRFDDATVAANHDYYEPRCSHNSSLSHAAYGMVAARLGRADAALEHFRATAQVDLLNTNHAVVAGTFIGGIHTAACGGTVQLAVQGIGGLGFDGDMIAVRPALPGVWERLDYPVTWRGHRLDVSVEHERVTVSAHADNAGAVRLGLPGGTVELAPGARVVR